MNVGEMLYGDRSELDISPHEHLKRKVTHTDTHTGIEFAFNSEELRRLLNGDED